ncbi:MAG: ABC transporter permease [Candidatus Nanopelagicaceae bacterium]|nr:ABC transporter permease [Candidatus Nanopelagicaceae bacterium]
MDNLRLKKGQSKNSEGFFYRLLAVPELGVIVALISCAVIFQSLNSVFLSSQVMGSIVQAVTFVSIIAVGQAFLLISGVFDLSVGAVAGLVAVSSGKLMTSMGWPVWAGIIGGLALGAAIGAVNGFMVTRAGVPAFIQTLGMMFVAQGMIQVVTKGYPVYPLPEVMTTIGESSFFLTLGWNAVIWVVVSLVGDFVIRKTSIGRNLYVIGGNSEVAKIVGINVQRYQMNCFILAGTLSALSGILVMATLSAGAPSIGGGWELTVIAGTVVGGVSLFGGVGTVAGAIMGVLLIQCVQSGLITSGLSPNFQLIAVGTILVLAVFLDVSRRGYRNRMRNSEKAETPVFPLEKGKGGGE